MAPLSAVQKLKLQLFHRLQRRHRDAWQRYWGAFQLYLAAKLSLDEFHALAEELLGPDKHLHNKFVVALLSTSYQQTEDGGQHSIEPPRPPEIQDHNGEGGGDTAASGEETTTPTSSDPLLQIIKEEGARHVCGDSEQRSSVQSSSRDVHGRKRSHSSVASAHDDAASSKLLHVHAASSNQDKLDVVEDHPDHHSAQLLIGLGKYSSANKPSSSRALETHVAPGTDDGRE